LAAVGQEARVDQVRGVAGLAAVVLARQVQRQPAHDVRLVLEIALRCRPGGGTTSSRGHTRSLGWWSGTNLVVDDGGRCVGQGSENERVVQRAQLPVMSIVQGGGD
jgi:hypothetical protein